MTLLLLGWAKIILFPGESLDVAMMVMGFDWGVGHWEKFCWNGQRGRPQGVQGQVVSVKLCRCSIIISQVVTGMWREV